MNNLPDTQVPTIQYAIFDVGQVIYPFSLNPLKALLEKLTTSASLYENNANPLHYNYNPYMKGEMNEEEFAKDLCTFCHVPYTKPLAKDIQRALHEGCGPRYEETTNAINYLKQRGLTICILSNALPALKDTVSEITTPQYIFASYQLGLLKPDTHIYERVRSALDVPYSHLLFIDDKAKNIEAAQKLGIHGIIYNRNTLLDDIKSVLQAEE